MKNLILYGTGSFAKIAHFYFKGYRNVVAFTVDRDYIAETEFCGLPVVAFEDIEDHYSTKENEIHVAVVYGDMNRLRERKCLESKQKGYSLASYFSPESFVDAEKVGEHCFIFEDNTIQAFTEIGDNCILWSGNHIGHDSVIGNNVFISSHVVISGHCKIGDNSFIGVNSTIPNGVHVGKECWISHGSVINSDIPDGSLVKPAHGSISTPLNETLLARALKKARR